jgi:hypothetical protein
MRRWILPHLLACTSPETARTAPSSSTTASVVCVLRRMRPSRRSSSGLCEQRQKATLAATSSECVRACGVFLAHLMIAAENVQGLLQQALVCALQTPKLSTIAPTHTHTHTHTEREREREREKHPQTHTHTHTHTHRNTHKHTHTHTHTHTDKQTDRPET